MKKILAGILALMYLTVTSGIAMEIHYCMGKKAGIEFYGSSSEVCGMCGMQEDKTGCCHDEHKFVKLGDSHKNVNNNISFHAFEKVILNYNPSFTMQLALATGSDAFENYIPPDYTGPSACILNGVFRI